MQIAEFSRFPSVATGFCHGTRETTLQTQTFDSQEGLDDKIRLPPQNLDAERGVLGSILLMNEAIDEVGETLKADHFYSDAHQKIYAAIQRLYENGVRGIDPVTLAEEMARKGDLEAAGGVAYLGEIIESVPHAAHVRYYASIVREKWMQRSLIYACTEILSECYEAAENIEDLLQSAERRIFGIWKNREAAPALRSATF